MDNNSFAGRGRGRGMVNDYMEDLRRPNVNIRQQIPQQIMPVLNNEIPLVLERNEHMDEVAAIAERLKKIDNLTNRNNISNNVQDSFKSTLSADAPVFVPRSLMVAHEPQAAAVQSPIYHPYFKGQQTMTEPQLDLFDHPTVVETNNLVVELSIAPDRYHTISRKITTLLNKNFDINVMKEVITVIFEQGQGEANFRYHGAKLCADLCKSVDRKFENKTFKLLLIERLHKEFEMKDTLLVQSAERLRGYVMFLAEIFTQVKTQDNLPIEILASSICELLRLLLSHSTDPNISCVTKVLKFTGSMVDSIIPAKMEVVFGDLRQVMLQPRLQENVKKQLLNIVELRAGNWGKGPPSPKSEIEPGRKSGKEPGPIPVFETVYYGPNGEINRVDEKCDDAGSDIDDPFWCPAELDLEAVAAFEEFLKMQQQEQPQPQPQPPQE